MKSIYQDMWQRAIEGYEKQQYFVDPYFAGKPDTRMGITLLARLPTHLTDGAGLFLSELDDVAPNQYLYPPSDMHVTVLSIVSCRADYRPSRTQRLKYLDILQQSLSAFPAFTIDFKGITAASTGVILCGYTADKTIENMRERVRQDITQSGIENTMDTRYRLRTAHSSVMRFASELENISALIQFLKANKERNFGEVKISQLELVYNDWYQSHHKTEVIGKIKLL